MQHCILGERKKTHERTGGVVSPDNVFIMGCLLSRLHGGENSCRGLLVTTETVQEICWTLKKTYC